MTRYSNTLDGPIDDIADHEPDCWCDDCEDERRAHAEEARCNYEDACERKGDEEREKKLARDGGRW